MSDHKLNTYVHAVEVDADGARTGREGVFGPDSDLSKPENEWALAAISNPDVWDGEAPPRAEPPPVVSPDDDKAELARLRAELAELKAAKPAQPDPEPGDEPEPPAASASRPEWVAYARTKGAPESELVASSHGGLTRDVLAERYGN